VSDIVVRPYEPNDREETFNVRAITYNSGRPIPIEQQVYKTSTPFVAEVGGRIVGTFVIMDMTCTRGASAAWKTGGIAGVAVLPEARHTGVGSAMMRWSLRHMREEGYVLAALYAFRESYYRRFGYEVCGMRYRITCPQSRLPKQAPELPIRRVFFKDLAEIKACYESFARARSGMNLRQDFHWGRIIDSDDEFTVYAAGNPVEGYLIVKHDWTFWNEQRIDEIAWSTKRGYESIFSFLSGLAINKTCVSWQEPADSPLLARHLDQGMKIESEKPIMYRLLDPVAALESYAAPGEGRFSIAIEDEDLPENSGPWDVCFADGETRVSRRDSAEVRLSPQAAIQVLLGAPSFADLVRNGYLPANEAASRFLPPSPVFCADHF
jgi:predicted acetyltransferase